MKNKIKIKELSKNHFDPLNFVLVPHSSDETSTKNETECPPKAHVSSML
jgi:hypothetical protein